MAAGVGKHVKQRDGIGCGCLGRPKSFPYFRRGDIVVAAESLEGA
jgi:hypothetical protein